MKPAVLDPTQAGVTGRSPLTEDWPPRGRPPAASEGYTVAEIQERLGPVPAWRVRSWPRPGTATFADAIACAERGELCELIDGILLEKTVGHWESVLGGRMFARMKERCDAGNLGVCAPGDGQIELPEGQTRLPDAAFTDWSRMPEGYRPEVAVPDLPPTIACEVISRGNTREEMDRKLQEYFDAGAKLVWYVRPRTRTVAVHSSPQDFTTLTADAGDVLTADGVLPGFAYPLAELFAVPAPPASTEAEAD